MRQAAAQGDGWGIAARRSPVVDPHTTDRGVLRVFSAVVREAEPLKGGEFDKYGIAQDWRPDGQALLGRMPRVRSGGGRRRGRAHRLGG